MFSMKKTKKLNLLAILTLTIFITTGCSSNLYHTGHAGYTKVYDAIEGYGFEIQSGMLESATAVTDISDDHDYSNGTFLYKNGKDAYLVFNIESFVISVSNSTNFNFGKKSDMEKILKEKDMNGIWFTPDEKPKFQQQTKSGCKKTEMNVVADVSITEDLFGTFSGTLTTIEHDGNECSLFIGVLGDEYKTISSGTKDVIDNVSDSLVAISKSDNSTEKIIVSTENNYADKENSTSTESVTSTEEASANTDSSGVTVTVIKEDDTEDTENIEPVQDTQTVIQSETQKENQASENTQITAPGTTEVRETVEPIIKIEDTQQHNTKSEDGLKNSDKKDTISKKLPVSIFQAEGKQSDIYHQLTIGQTGECTGMGTGGTDTDVEIRLDYIYTGNKANKLIKSLKCNNKYIKDISPRRGTSFCVAEYSMSESPDNVYLDGRIVGLDGEKLKYRGVSFEERSYDARESSLFKDGFYSKLYIIYAVPNGCTEYTLRFGTQKNSAFYKISQKDKHI